MRVEPVEEIVSKPKRVKKTEPVKKKTEPVKLSKLDRIKNNLKVIESKINDM